MLILIETHKRLSRPLAQSNMVGFSCGHRLLGVAHFAICRLVLAFTPL